VTQAPGKVLITGAGGFIGQALRRRLKERGIAHVAAVRALSSADESSPECVALGDFAAADWTPALAGVDAIVHLAGRAQAQRGLHGDATPYLVANVHVTRRLLDAAAAAGVRRLVIGSVDTMHVVAFDEGMRWVDTHSTPLGGTLRSFAVAPGMDSMPRHTCRANRAVLPLRE